jgi:ring-1,2-phenylacetyl-CoA epoxidase subunit PaaC
MSPTSDEFDAYQGLNDETEDHRWAFGTGFTDPLEGVDATVPGGVDAAALAAYCLMLGDDALIYSHRLQQWMTRLPELEEETALANIALDLLGQARMLLARAGQAEGAARPDGHGRAEDELAFFRDEHEFRNVRLVEGLDADFAELTGRLLVFSTWRLALFGELARSRDPVLAAIAAKGVKELTYHRDYAARWVIRLGDGTPLSHGKMQAALGAIWPLTDELFRADPVAAALPGVAVDPATLRAEVSAVLDTVLAAADLDRPGAAPMAPVAGQTGRDGVHTEALGYILAELQSVARAHPGATW